MVEVEEPECAPSHSNSAPPAIPPRPPVPKPRTKFTPVLTERECLSPSPPTVSSERVPPPRPPPPKFGPYSPRVSTLPPPPPPPSAPSVPKTNRSPTPPALPPRPDPKLVQNESNTTDVRMIHPALIPEENIMEQQTENGNGKSTDDVLPSPALPSPLTSSRPSPPPVGWLLPKQPSMDESLEPLPGIPSGVCVPDEVIEESSECDMDPVNLIPDRPDINDPGPMCRPPLPSISPISVASSSPSCSSPEPVSPTSEFVRIDYVENPVYLSLDAFRSTCISSPSVPKSTTSRISFIFNPAYLPNSVITPPNSTAENTPVKKVQTPIKIDVPPEIQIERPHQFNEKTVPLYPHLSPLSSSDPDAIPPVAPPRSPRIHRPAPPRPSASPPLPVITNDIRDRELPITPTDDIPDEPDEYAQVGPREIQYPEIPFRAPSSAVGIEQTFVGDSLNTDSYFFPTFETVESVDIPDEDVIEVVHSDHDDVDYNVADGLSICFSGFAEYYTGKKDKKTVHIRLRQMRIAVYEDEEAEEPIAGPYDLPKAEFVGRQADTDTIVCRFIPSDRVERRESKSKKDKDKDREAQRELKFTPTDQVEAWLLILAECWVGSFECLRNCISSGMTCCGRLWLRQGTTAAWTFAAAFMHNMTVYYIVIDKADIIYELDVRKVIGIKSKLDESDWCPLAKKKEKGKDKGSGGPFLISVEGSSLCLECDDAASSVLWLRALEVVLSRNGNCLEESRLTGDEVPWFVEKCVRFVSTYGLTEEGIYRRNGKITEAKEIMKQMMQDPVEYHIVKETNETVFAVADVLRQFLRRLDRPLFPVEFHDDMYNIYKSQDSFPEKCGEYREIFHKFPAVAYSTIRRLIGHLKEVTEQSSINKATSDNIAKVFGPSVFAIEKDLTESFEYKDTSAQIGVLVDLINGFASIFQMTTREAITRAKMDVAAHICRHNKVRAEGLLIPIHMWEKENRPFNVQTEMVADEVCREAISMRGFDAPPHSKYAIFEVIRGNSLSRRLNASEKLSSVVVKRWLEWHCTDGILLFNHDTNPYEEDNSSAFSGKVKVAEPGSRSFKSAELRIENGIKIGLYRGVKQQHIWEVDETVWYTGAESNRKAPYPFSLTFFHLPSTVYSDKFAGYCISFKLVHDRLRFLNAVHFAQTRGEPPLLVHL